LLVRALRRKDQPLGKPRKQWAAPPDAERESVFSWGHLLDQILGLARSLFGRLRRAGGDVGPATAPRANALANTGSVRHGLLWWPLACCLQDRLLLRRHVARQ
jgi:hypothetical protein